MVAPSPNNHNSPPISRLSTFEDRDLAANLATRLVVASTMLLVGFDLLGVVLDVVVLEGRCLPPLSSDVCLGRPTDEEDNLDEEAPLEGRPILPLSVLRRFFEGRGVDCSLEAVLRFDGVLGVAEPIT